MDWPSDLQMEWLLVVAWLPVVAWLLVVAWLPVVAQACDLRAVQKHFAIAQQELSPRRVINIS